MIPLPPDPYKILSVAPDAQLADIRAAHRRLVKLYHPDKIGADATEEERKIKEDEFKKVQKAYELLSDENERRKYDDQLIFYRRYQLTRKTANAAAAFNTPRRADTWQPESPTTRVHVDIRVAEPKPGTYSKSPPKTTESTSKSSAKVQRTTTEPQRARRSPSYESHPSPTDEKNREQDAREQELAEREKEIRRRERKLREEKEELEREKKRAEKRSEAKSSKKEEKSSRKAKDPYVEEPNRGSDETYISKSVSKSKSGKSHKHRSKADRSRSRSNTRGEKPVKKKESREKSRLRPEAIRAEIEEPSDTDTGVDSSDEVSRNLRNREEYIKFRKNGSLNMPPLSAPTPPPLSSARVPPPPGPTADVPPATERVHAHIVDVKPPPRLNRSTTAPSPAAYPRPMAIPMESSQYNVYTDGLNSRARSRTRQAQHYYPEDEDSIEDIRSGTRSRRGSSNTYGQSYSGRSYPDSQFYEHQSSYYPSGTSPKYPASVNNVRHVHGVPGRVYTSRLYGENDINYAQVPHQHTDPQFV